MTRRAPRRRVAHVDHGQPYHLEDSWRGVVHFVIRLLFPWIDLDCHVTRDGVLVITHWPRPMVHDGFFDPGPTKAQPWPKVPASTAVEDMTWAQVSRLRTRDGYRIARADKLVPFVLKHGGRVELEMKTNAITSAQLADLRAVLTKPKRVQVKAFTKYRRPLAAAHDLGFVTIELTPAAVDRPDVDYWRRHAA